ncbi:MAG: flavodoxin family protein [Candidatus Heimdallarchaeota archaeon]|nr:flavodoxin family protein [Candidatus Heimdallarchaeota archaeon]
MVIKVLGIVGSPRKGGNTDLLVDEILAGSSEAGAIITKIHLNDLNIAPCQACYHCRDYGEYKNQDDMI